MENNQQDRQDLEMDGNNFDGFYVTEHDLGELMCAANNVQMLIGDEVLETIGNYAASMAQPQNMTDLAPEVNFHPTPEHWDKFPNLETVDTNHAFEMRIDSGESQNWVYSASLEKAYIKMNSAMKVTLCYKPRDATNLFIRAMVLYSSADDTHLPVKRCANHRVATDNNQDVPQAHILKCCHPKTQYVGGETGHVFGERLSVVVPLDRPAVNEDGCATESLMLQFMCQNSCTTGINRKPTAVAFTLENSRNEILGKRFMPFKVCSCPKRDMQRDAAASMRHVPRKRGASCSAAAYGKRAPKMARPNEIKIEPSNPSPSSSVGGPLLPTPVTATLTMPDNDSMQHVLRCAFNEIHGSINNTANRGNEQKKKYLLVFAEKIKGLLGAYS